jgi:hypothetical protein
MLTWLLISLFSMNMKLIATEMKRLVTLQVDCILAQLVTRKAKFPPVYKFDIQCVIYSTECQEIVNMSKCGKSKKTISRSYCKYKKWTRTCVTEGRVLLSARPIIFVEKYVWKCRSRRRRLHLCSKKQLLYYHQLGIFLSPLQMSPAFLSRTTMTTTSAETSPRRRRSRRMDLARSRSRRTIPTHRAQQGT